MPPWHRSMTGSPKVLTRPTSRRPRHCWRRWHNTTLVVTLFLPYHAGRVCNDVSMAQACRWQVHRQRVRTLLACLVFCILFPPPASNANKVEGGAETRRYHPAEECTAMTAKNSRQYAPSRGRLTCQRVIALLVDTTSTRLLLFRKCIGTGV